MPEPLQQNMDGDNFPTGPGPSNRNGQSTRPNNRPTRSAPHNNRNEQALSAPSVVNNDHSNSGYWYHWFFASRMPYPSSMVNNEQALTAPNNNKLKKPQPAHLARPTQPTHSVQPAQPADPANTPNTLKTTLPQKAQLPNTSDPTACVICLSHLPAPPRAVLVHPCSHEFCLECIQKWIKVQRKRASVKASQCPVCRGIIHKIIDQDGKEVEDLKDEAVLEEARRIMQG